MIVRPADNPFASRRIDGLRFRSRVGGIDDVVATLADNGNRGAVIGPHGSGKTTFLAALGDRLEGDIVRVELSADTDQLLQNALDQLPAVVDRGHAVLVDGAERLGHWAWWRLQRRIRHAGSLVITGHRPGRLPTIYRCTTEPSLLRELVRELAPELIDTVDLDDLFHRLDGNIRLCLRELYDHCAGR